MELLRRTGVVFLNGDPSAAAQAYERIFTVVEGAMENGWSVASQPGDTDVMKEAAAGTCGRWASPASVAIVRGACGMRRRCWGGP